jgi:O-antigen/teichoic acid export membrane protein
MSTLKLLLIGLGSRVTSIVLVMVSIVMLARGLGPAGVGEYFLLLRLVAILTVFADLGLRLSANVFSGHHEEWTGLIHGILLRFTLWSSVCTSLVAAGVIWWAKDILLPNFPGKWVWVALIVLPMSLYANFWNGMMIGRGRIWQMNLVQLIVSIISLVLIAVFITGLSRGVAAAVTIYLSTTVFQFSIMAVMVYRSTPVPEIRDAPTDLHRQMLKFGLRAYPGALSVLLWMNAPVFLLNSLYGMAAVGIFSVAHQIVEKLLLPIQSMQDAIFKKISGLSPQAAISAMNRYVRVTWWPTAISMLVGVIFGPWLVVFFLGERFFATGQVCRLLLPGTAVMSVPFLLGAYFLSQLRRPGLLSILSWINAVINLILSLVFISRFAEIGAALAITTSQIFGTALALMLYMKMTQTRFRQLISLNREDVAIVRQQVGALLHRSERKNDD